jgi:hypothetical protein
MFDPVTLDLLHWCGKWRIALREELGKLQSGRTLTHSTETGQLVDTTPQTTAQFKEWLSGLDAIIAKLSNSG